MRWWPKRKHAKNAEATNIGNVFIKLGLISKEQLASAIEEQAQKDASIRLGQTLVSMQLVTEEELHAALVLQRRLRNGQGATAMLELVEQRTERIHRRMVPMEEQRAKV